MRMMEGKTAKEEEPKKEEKKEEKKEAKEEVTTKGGKAVKDKEMQEALKVAQEAERLEEEEFMKKAIEESKR